MNAKPPARDPGSYEDAYEDKRFHDEDEAPLHDGAEEGLKPTQLLRPRPQPKKPTYRPTRRYVEE